MYNRDTWAQEEVEKAPALGLIPWEPGLPTDYRVPITRQEAAVMLTRAYGVIGGALPQNQKELPFLDGEKIAAYAKESAAILALWAVMKGMENGSFVSEGNYSVGASFTDVRGHYAEQAVEEARLNQCFQAETDICTVAITNLMGTPP